MKISGTTIVIIALAILVIGPLFGWYIINPPATPGVTPPGTTPPGDKAATLQLEVIHFISSAKITTSAVTVDTSKAVSGVFDLLTQADTLTYATNPDQMGTIYPEGSELILRVGCTGNPTGGLDYYDGWYYVKLAQDNPIYVLTPSMLTVVSSSPTYTYSVSTAGAETTGHTVSWTELSSTGYWDLGKLAMYPRSSAANYDTHLSNTSHVLATVTDGSSWVDTAAEITANWTMPSDDEKVTLSVTIGAVDLGWGWPLYVISQKGKLESYNSFIVVTTSMTALGNTKMVNGDWKKINDGTLYAEVAYYYDVTANMGPQYTSKGTKHEFTLDIPIDASAAAASTAFLWNVWALDCQLETNVAVGSTTTSLPTAYGMVTAYGPGALVQASAYSTSSGVGSGELLQVYLTTAA